MRPIPALNEICIDLSTGPGELCVVFPGGSKLCAQVGYGFGDPTEITQALIAQVNGALAPMIPIFDLIDLAKRIADCLQAIPDAITSLDPTPILQCMPELVKKLNALLQLLPITSVPLLVKSILDVMIQELIGLKLELSTIIRQQQRIMDAATKAAKVGSLRLVVDCAEANNMVRLENLNASLKPLNRLVGMLNLLLNQVGLPCIPTFASIAEAAIGQLAIIDNGITILEQIKAAIPVLEITLPPIPAPTDPCK